METLILGLRDALDIARKDLRIELRAREIVPTMTLFAALVAILASMALYVDDDTGRRVAPGVLWIVLAFSGTLGLSRAWSREREQSALRGVLLSPIAAWSVFLGKSLGSLLFVSVTLAVVTPLVALLLHAPLWTYLAPSLLLLSLGALGFVLAGTLFGAMTARTRARDLLLAVVLYPLTSPALLAGAVATREVFEGRFGDYAQWVRLLVAYDVIVLAAGLGLMEWLLAD
ncbi:MAG: heme exporter protein CcmB [Deltaproteobacteria bacterium]|nr:heme exporter protein CcmB [Deltaproteobacteria bacterium]